MQQIRGLQSAYLCRNILFMKRKIEILSLKSRKEGELFYEKQPDQFNLLLDSIREHGVLTPIVIDGNHCVIDGQMRVEACKILGLETIPYQEMSSSFDSDELAVLNYNRYRSKTLKDKILEFKILSKHFKKMQGKRSDLTNEQPKNRRESFAKYLGFSPSNVGKLERIITDSRINSDVLKLIDRGDATIGGLYNQMFVANKDKSISKILETPIITEDAVEHCYVKHNGEQDSEIIIESDRSESDVVTDRVKHDLTEIKNQIKCPHCNEIINL